MEVCNAYIPSFGPVNSPDVMCRYAMIYPLFAWGLTDFEIVIKTRETAPTTTTATSKQTNGTELVQQKISCVNNVNYSVSS